MSTITDIFQTSGSTEDQSKLFFPLQRIFFPWDLLKPTLASSGIQKIKLEYADLSGYGLPKSADMHILDEHGNIGHAILVEHLPEEFKHFRDHPHPAGDVAGLAWYGKIQVSDVYRNNQSVTDWVISAEIAHEVDFFYLDPNDMRTALTRLVHHGATDAHPWFGGPYWEQVGEGWMSGFGIAYTDFVAPDPRFLHAFAVEMVPEIRTILRAQRTDDGQPPPIDPSFVEFDGIVVKPKAGKITVRPTQPVTKNIAGRQIRATFAEGSFNGRIKSMESDWVVIKPTTFSELWGLRGEAIHIETID